MIEHSVLKTVEIASPKHGSDWGEASPSLMSEYGIRLEGGFEGLYTLGVNYWYLSGDGPRNVKVEIVNRNEIVNLNQHVSL